MKTILVELYNTRKNEIEDFYLDPKKFIITKDFVNLNVEKVTKTFEQKLNETIKNFINSHKEYEHVNTLHVEKKFSFNTIRQDILRII